MDLPRNHRHRCILTFVLIYSVGSIVHVNSYTEANLNTKPNIILIIADDLGWNDVGFHGSNEIPTPNIDALAYNGLILNRHYVLPTCVPSRASLMTGKYAIRTGLQGDPGSPTQAWALSGKETLLPQRLKNFGYRTHLIGKWHLGFYRTKFTPTQRGYDTHFGYFNGWLRYNDSIVSSGEVTGLDARRNLEKVAEEFREQYLTDVFTKEAVNIIRQHNSKHLLFMQISHAAPHAIRKDLLQVRNVSENDRQFAYIQDKNRQLLAGTLSALDESIGKVVEALNETNQLDNSVIVFMTDNGGATEDVNWQLTNYASNWPLRGMKTSLFEGGVRGVAVVWSPYLKRNECVTEELFHISDWLPTFISAAGGCPMDVESLDGVDQWKFLTGQTEKSPRKEVLINVDKERKQAAFIQENWKLIHFYDNHSETPADKYGGVTGRCTSNYKYDLEKVITSKTFQLTTGNYCHRTLLCTEKNSENHAIVAPTIVTSVKCMTQNDCDINVIKEYLLKKRAMATLDKRCEKRIADQDKLKDQSFIISTCDNSSDHQFLLYDLSQDPCEYNNLAGSSPDLVKLLKSRLDYFESITLPQIRRPNDERADPKNFNGYWSPWLDSEKSFD